ncbi:MAG: divergent PAP2 family protein [Alkalispirochaeta sp.]
MDQTTFFGIPVVAFFALPLVISVISQVSAQIFKVVLYSVAERRFAIDRLVNAAGMPSAHTAFVTALAASIGLQRGVSSDIFAVAFVFAAIVIYDSFRLRGHVQRHAEALNRLLAPRRELPGSSYSRRDPQELSEHVGHTGMEVVAGIIWGLVFAMGLS